MKLFLLRIDVIWICFANFTFGSQQTNNRHAWYPCCATINVNRWTTTSESKKKDTIHVLSSVGAKESFLALRSARQDKTKHRNSFSVPSDQILLPSSASVNMSSRCHQLRSASDNKLMVINWLRDIHRCNLFSWNCWQGKNCLPALFTLSSSCAAARMDVCFLEGAGNSSASRSGANQTNVAQLLSLRGISSCFFSSQRTEDD